MRFTDIFYCNKAGKVLVVFYQGLLNPYVDRRYFLNMLYLTRLNFVTWYRKLHKNGAIKLKTQFMKFIILRGTMLLFVSGIFFNGFSQYKWKLAKDKDGIKVYVSETPQ